VKALFHPAVTDIRKGFIFIQGSQAWSGCTSGKRNVQMKMIMEHWWNGTDRGKRSNGEKKPVQCLLSSILTGVRGKPRMYRNLASLLYRPL
jgi:hypothetical protein